MKLSGIKLNFLRQQNREGVAIIQKIEEFADKHHISYNKAITYFESNYDTPYEKRVLGICRELYPYDGEFSLENQQETEIETGPIQKENIIFDNPIVDNVKQEEKVIISGPAIIQNDVKETATKQDIKVQEIPETVVKETETITEVSEAISEEPVVSVDNKEQTVAEVTENDVDISIEDTVEDTAENKSNVTENKHKNKRNKHKNHAE